MLSPILVYENNGVSQYFLAITFNEQVPSSILRKFNKLRSDFSSFLTDPFQQNQLTAHNLKKIIYTRHSHCFHFIILAFPRVQIIEKMLQNPTCMWLCVFFKFHFCVFLSLIYQKSTKLKENSNVTLRKLSLLVQVQPKVVPNQQEHKILITREQINEIHLHTTHTLTKR